VSALRIAVIGCGYWGPNHVRTFAELPGVDVVAIADFDDQRLEQMRVRHPQIRHFVHDYRDLFDLELDAVVICTPPETHFEIARASLQNGLDVFVEKPLATNTLQAQRLVELADSTGRVVMVGHIGAYNSAVVTLRSMIQRGSLGHVAYIDAVRAGLGLFHPTLNVVWDLAPHDIAIFLFLFGESPTSVCARGIACVEQSVEDVAYMTLTFPSGVLAHARLSWLDPCKMRRITVVGNRKMAVFDDLESHEKLKIYDKSVASIRRTESFGDFQFAYHYGSVISPFIRQEEPLRVECLHFIECVLERKTPLTDVRNGLEVVKVIEAAQRSLREGGTLISLDATGDGRSPADDRANLVTLRSVGREPVSLATGAEG
jgi:predicted dehydrogenase